MCRRGSEMRVARAALHFWEEPPISGSRGSGTVFFTGCTLGCVFCQNGQISHGPVEGRKVTPQELSDLFFDLIAQGAHNINLVTPTHFVPQIRQALLVKKLPVPVVYNTSGYERVETLRSLEGLVDIYLPDYKYDDPALAKALSRAEDYPQRAQAALAEMVRQVGAPVYDGEGLMTRGVLIRHLILPGHTKNSIACLERIRQLFPGIPVSLMAQYTPVGSWIPSRSWGGPSPAGSRRRWKTPCSSWAWRGIPSPAKPKAPSTSQTGTWKNRGLHPGQFAPMAARFARAHRATSARARRRPSEARLKVFAVRPQDVLAFFSKRRDLALTGRQPKRS